ncbi:SpcZ [Streptomyces adustus]|uniref:SpcZ n=1 Tax=Streptomyces adustus TaxID=1609272 RepID=A0A5N8V862_9ACTN|nr:SpcZ [Streptomyces adustus]MPY30228.1 SpcZ [Streptomyces adustus]
MTTRLSSPPETAETPPVPHWTVQVAGALTDEASGDEGPVHPAAGTSFAALHLWHAGTVADLIGEAVARHGGDPAPHEALRAVHARAAAGEVFGENAWSAVLEPALREVYRLAYPGEQVRARAAAAASSFALSRGWAEEDAEDYGNSYARMHTEVSERVHAGANAVANAAAYALAFATRDAWEYAHAWPFALVQAWIAAYAGPADLDGPVAQEARARLRGGLAEAVRCAIA